MDYGRLFLVFGASGMVGIAVSALYGAALRRQERLQRNVRPGQPLPDEVIEKIWERSAAPTAITILALFVCTVLLRGFDLDSAAELFGLAAGAYLRGVTR